MNPEDMFASVGESTEDTEFFTSLPPGYKPGQTKFVIVVGTVMSGLGKGIFSSSLARILQDKGLSVAPIKLEGYLNRDSGTLNPYRHGEVFVLDDGMECDMDLGTYERMLNQDLTRLNFSTSGQIFSRVLEKERKGEYLGRDVQMIPHVTGEVKYHLRQLAVETGTDVVFVEIGGTAGDVENAYYLEAVRELAFEEGPNSCCFVALTYVVEPPSLGEQKSKPAQLNIKQLMAVGIMPHIIACRASRPVTRKVLEKLAMYSNVPIDRVFSMHDVETVYMIPEALREDGIDETVLETLDLKAKTDPKVEAESRANWSDYLSKYRAASTPVTIGITGKYTSLRDSYASIIQALEHAGTHHGIKVDIVWIDSTELSDQNVAQRLSGVDGVIIPGGFGVRGVDGKIACVKYAREHGLPYLGLCYGFQIAVIEFARNVCGLKGAGSTEIDPNAPHPVIDILPEQRALASMGGNMRLGGQDIDVAKGLMVSQMYGGVDSVRLRFRHRYEVAPDYIERLEAAGLVFCGRSPDQRIMQILELSAAEHPYFVATQAHAELTSRPLRPDPMFLGLVEAARDFSGGGKANQTKSAKVTAD
ncbi:MAG TPA: CTP synthase (glutamine hydrolyzing) [Phycisphaerae bacterium]|nr:CTP synthase (glutamine hydrolyzing) [Phycisphaerae bacterium]